MSQPQRTMSAESNDAIRKRVCKACDRCRLKKSKCDGSNPCSRCKADNAICVFGERKKSHDKVYPKGYVEMLEQQQGQLVSGLQLLYQQLLKGHLWGGPVLSETSGHPLTHDILAALNLLESRHDGSEMETFEEDCQKLQSKLLADGAGYLQRRGSFSSESEHSQHGNSRSSTHSTSTVSKPPALDSFSLSASPSPLAQSPISRQRLSYPPAQQSPLHQNFPTANDPQFYQPEWTFSNAGAMMRPKFAFPGPQIQQSLDDVESMMGIDQWNESAGSYDLCAGNLSAYPQQLSNAFGSMPGMQDYAGGLDPIDLEFNKYIQVAT